MKTCNLLIPRLSLRTSRLHEKSSSLTREHQALQNLKFLWIIFVLLVPDPDPSDQKECGSGFGSTTLFKSLLYLVLAASMNFGAASSNFSFFCAVPGTKLIFLPPFTVQYFYKIYSY